MNTPRVHAPTLSLKLSLVAAASVAALVASACTRPLPASENEKEKEAQKETSTTSATPAPVDLAARGKQLVTMGGCNDCHTPMVFDPKLGMPVPDVSRRLSGHPAGASDPAGQPGKGDQAVIGSTFTSFRTPFGVVYAANLTSDADTGLGRWTEADFIATMRTGHRKGKERVILPPMPWQNLSQLPDVDLRAMFAYLRTVPAVSNAVPAPKVAPEAVAAIEQGYVAAKGGH